MAMLIYSAILLTTILQHCCESYTIDNKTDYVTPLRTPQPFMFFKSPNDWIENDETIAVTSVISTKTLATTTQSSIKAAFTTTPEVKTTGDISSNATTLPTVMSSTTLTPTAAIAISSSTINQHQLTDKTTEPSTMQSSTETISTLMLPNYLQSFNNTTTPSTSSIISTTTQSNIKTALTTTPEVTATGDIFLNDTTLSTVTSSPTLTPTATKKRSTNNQHQSTTMTTKPSIIQSSTETVTTRLLPYYSSTAAPKTTNKIPRNCASTMETNSFWPTLWPEAEPDSWVVPTDERFCLNTYTLPRRYCSKNGNWDPFDVILCSSVSVNKLGYKDPQSAVDLLANIINSNQKTKFTIPEIERIADILESASHNKDVTDNPNNFFRVYENVIFFADYYYNPSQRLLKARDKMLNSYQKLMTNFLNTTTTSTMSTDFATLPTTSITNHHQPNISSQPSTSPPPRKCVSVKESNLFWPETKPGSWIVPSNVKYCLHANYIPVRRHCSDDGNWDPPEATSCSSVNLTQITKKLIELVEKDPQSAVDSLANVTKSNQKNFTVFDIHLISNILDLASQNENVIKNSDNFFVVHNNVMNFDTKVLNNSQQLLNCIDKINNSKDRIISSITTAKTSKISALPTIISTTFTTTAVKPKTEFTTMPKVNATTTLPTALPSTTLIPTASSSTTNQHQPTIRTTEPSTTHSSTKTVSTHIPPNYSSTATSSTTILMPRNCASVMETHLVWPEAEPGSWVVPSNVKNCLHANYTPVRRHCSKNGIWDPPEANFCSSVNLTQITKNLIKLVDEDPQSAIDTLANLTKSNQKNLTAFDLHLMSDILDSASQNENVVNNPINFFKVVDNIMNFEKEVLGSSQKLLNSTDKILYSIDRLLLRGNISKITTPNLFLRSIETSINITGAIIGSKNNSDNFNSFEIKYLNNHEFVENEFEIAFVVPPSFTENRSQYYITLFHNDHLFNQIKEYSVGSWILSILIPNAPKYSSSTIEIYFKAFNYGFNQQCQHWKYGKNKREHTAITGRWKFDNQAQKLNDNFYLCKVNHTTHFGMLVSGSIPDYYILNVITTIGFTFSVIGICIVVLTGLVFKRWRTTSNSKMILNVSICMIFLITTFIISNRVNSGLPCIIIGILLHYFVIAHLCWSMAISYASYRRYYLVFADHIRHVVTKFCFFSWGTPIIVVATVASVNIHTYDNDRNPNQMCYPKEIYLQLGVCVPMVIILSINLIIYIIIIKNLVARKSSIRRHVSTNIRIVQKKLFLLFFTMGIAWIFGIFVSFTDDVVFVYLFCITTTFYGFIIFFFYILDAADVKQHWKNFYKEISQRTSSNRQSTDLPSQTITE